MRNVPCQPASYCLAGECFQHFLVVVATDDNADMSGLPVGSPDVAVLSLPGYAIYMAYEAETLNYKFCMLSSVIEADVALQITGSY